MTRTVLSGSSASTSGAAGSRALARLFRSFLDLTAFGASVLEPDLHTARTLKYARHVSVFIYRTVDKTN